MMKAFSLAFWVLLLCLRAAWGAESGQAVVLIYNSRMPESKMVADHYAARRNVPPGQILGLDLPTDETMSRADYRTRLAGPLLEFLKDRQLLVYPPDAETNSGRVKPIAASVRYAALCYGVPLRIAEDPTWSEPEADKMPEPLRRNGAAVDSELCLLPVLNPHPHLYGPSANPLFRASHGPWMDPTNGLLMVTRLDGPSAEIALQLVDKSIEAETNGLWGRAYFDLRGLTSGDYKIGDDWIGAAAEMTRRFGFETVVDNQPETFASNFPMSQIALYAGWYDGAASGPFSRPTVEFMPGAFAYHLHSYSAHTLRTTTNYWCGPLLAKGVTATMGCIDEPFLQGTPDIEIFFARWVISGFSFGEAAYACQSAVSWQTTVIGDPLYRPFGKDPRAQNAALLARHSKLIEWSDLRLVNLNLVNGTSPGELIKYLTSSAVPKGSAVLAEKLGDLYKLEGHYDLSAKSYRKALKFDPTPEQRVRLELDLAADPPGK